MNIVDEYTREALAMRVGRTCDAEDVVATVEALVAHRGAPAHLGMTTARSWWRGPCGSGAAWPAPA